MPELNVEKRDTSGTKAAAAVRASGRMPAVVYGRTHKPEAITVSMKDFEKVWKEAGESAIVVLTGLSEHTDVLINDVDVDPVTGNARHADFYAIEKGKKVEVSVPLEFMGIAPAEKELGGIIIKVLHELDIEALPKDLPHEIPVDLTMLKDLESVILVKDLMLPAGVTAVADSEDVIATVSVAQDESEEAATTPDLSSIEISEDRGKKAEESEE